MRCPFCKRKVGFVYPYDWNYQTVEACCKCAREKGMKTCTKVFYRTELQTGRKFPLWKARIVAIINDSEKQSEGFNI